MRWETGNECAGFIAQAVEKHVYLMERRGDRPGGEGEGWQVVQILSQYSKVTAPVGSFSPCALTFFWEFAYKMQDL